ncbi:hypothetical protein NDN01_19840 [Sphingomonas sp. QA11]|nr:hypothetical protein [Sphingomonas sp. QA11]WCM26235.1 hypothetical protein NDN01_19840 [Sphingomonas sp. QA11]
MHHEDERVMIPFDADQAAVEERRLIERNLLGREFGGELRSGGLALLRGPPRRTHFFECSRRLVLDHLERLFAVEDEARTERLVPILQHGDRPLDSGGIQRPLEIEPIRHVVGGFLGMLGCQEP